MLIRSLGFEIYLAQGGTCIRKKVLEYPGRKRGERWGLTKQFVDQSFILFSFPGKRNLKLDITSRPYFSPDGRCLVLHLSYEEGFGICKLP